MVERQLRQRDISDPKVLEVMAEVPREVFVPPEIACMAYRDGPLSIGYDQTISQPYMVALMTAELSLSGKEKVLEIGTGSGYQTAILSRMAGEVVTVERIGALSESAKSALCRLDCRNVTFVVGDGSIGYLPLAPYDRILVTAGAPSIPPALVEQLADPGILVIPSGSRMGQTLYRVTKENGLVEETTGIGCIFVPLVGDQGWPDDGV